MSEPLIKDYEYLAGEKLAAFVHYMQEETDGNPCGMACCKCRFWEPMDFPEADMEGRVMPYSGCCRRRAPMLPTQDILSAGVDKPNPWEGQWPETQWYDWCGEFEPSDFSALDALERQVDD